LRLWTKIYHFDMKIFIKTCLKEGLVKGYLLNDTNVNQSKNKKDEIEIKIFNLISKCDYLIEETKFLISNFNIIFGEFIHFLILGF
jgi:hypothetical protein